MLHINDVTLRLGPRVLFDKATMVLPPHTRVAFVGRNGTGKTTLFKIIAGELAPEASAISLPRATRLGRVEQEAQGGPRGGFPSRFRTTTGSAFSAPTAMANRLSRSLSPEG
jgi:ATP-binding cassette, subfamily F, member 3